MFNRACVLSALGLATVSLIVYAPYLPAGAANQVSDGILASWVQHAKVAGLKEILLPPGIPTPTNVRTADRLIRERALLRVAATDAVTVNNRNSILTWYKIKVLETIRSQPQLPQERMTPGIPARLLPVAASEKIYVIAAGTVVIDGIRLTQVPMEKGLVLRVGRQYVGAFFLKDQGRLAGLPEGADGLYEVNGDELLPQTDKESDLVKDFRRVCKNHLSGLRLAARR